LIAGAQIQGTQFPLSAAGIIHTNKSIEHVEKQGWPCMQCSRDVGARGDEYQDVILQIMMPQDN
jgi:hypothetical protein